MEERIEIVEWKQVEENVWDTRSVTQSGSEWRLTLTNSGEKRERERERERERD